MNWRWSIRDVPLLVRAGVTVAVYRLLLWSRPLKQLRERIDRMPLARQRPIDPLRIGQAVTSVAHRLPRCDCLPRALATQVLLRRCGINSQLCIGVRRDGDQFAAHAWVTCEGRVIIGEVAGADFAELKRAG